jgi:hypothetical protein
MGVIGDIGFIGLMGFIVDCFVKAAGPSEKEARPTARTTGKWSLTPLTAIYLQQSICAPRMKNPSKHASE